MAYEQKTFDQTLVYYPDEKKSCTPQNDVHTSEDILTKMIKKIHLTLNLLWVVHIYIGWNFNALNQQRQKEKDKIV